MQRASSFELSRWVESDGRKPFGCRKELAFREATNVDEALPYIKGKAVAFLGTPSWVRAFRNWL